MTEVEIDKLIKELTKEFEVACKTHNSVLGERESNRAKKELLRGSSKGTRLHYYQTEFSWILHDIKMGPIFFIEDNVEKAKKLIEDINKIADQS